ncbi:MAG: hypothetical protein K1X39_02950 [Thermoflexales bacterium]|nr:hypothetical protein [Thermoflexales bacterium]
MTRPKRQALSTRAAHRLRVDVSAAPFDEGPLLAVVVPFMVWVPVWGIMLGSVFLPGMPLESAGLFVANGVFGMGIAALWGMVGLFARRANPHRRTAVARTHVAAFLTALGLAFQVHGIGHSIVAALAAFAANVVLLAVGVRWRNDGLAFLSGERQGALRVAALLEFGFGALIGLTGLVVQLPFLQATEPPAFMAFVAVLLAVLGMPWVPILLVWARMHWRAAGNPNELD